MGVRRGSRSQVGVARGADTTQHRNKLTTLGTRSLFARRRGEQMAPTGTVGTEQPDRLCVGQSTLCLRSPLFGLRDPDGDVTAGTMRLPPSVPDVCLEHMTISANKANRHNVFLLVPTVHTGSSSVGCLACGCPAVNLTRDVAQSFTPRWKKARSRHDTEAVAEKKASGGRQSSDSKMVCLNMR
jgi:hypothetical protein